MEKKYAVCFVVSGMRFYLWKVIDGIHQIRDLHTKDEAIKRAESINKEHGLVSMVVDDADDVVFKTTV